MATIVDVHCHNFNGDDLPVRGFIPRVQFDDAGLAAVDVVVHDLAIRA